MSMSKKDFVALADVFIRLTESDGEGNPERRRGVIDTMERLADFCAAQNPRFNRERWLAYIAGECGPNGGAVKGGYEVKGPFILGNVMGSLTHLGQCFDCSRQFLSTHETVYLTPNGSTVCEPCGRKRKRGHARLLIGDGRSFDLTNGQRLT